MKLYKFPKKERIDSMISHWVMRYLKYKHQDVIIDDIELIEDISMLATNLEKWFENTKRRCKSEQTILVSQEVFAKISESLEASNKPSEQLVQMMQYHRTGLQNDDYSTIR